MKKLHEKGLSSSNKHKKGKPCIDQAFLAQTYANIIANLLANLQVIEDKQGPDDDSDSDKES